MNLLQLNYLDVHFLVQILYRKREGLVPRRVQVSINHFAFVERFPIHFELHVRITGT